MTEKAVFFGLNRVPFPNLLTSPFWGTPLPPPQGRSLLWMVPNKWNLWEFSHKGQNSKQINIAKYVSKFLICGAIGKCVKSQKKFCTLSFFARRCKNAGATFCIGRKKRFLYIFLFCKVKLSKMVFTKRNKTRKQTPPF